MQVILSAMTAYQTIRQRTADNDIGRSARCEPQNRRESQGPLLGKLREFFYLECREDAPRCSHTKTY